MTRYAQTNLQLFQQLFALGYDSADLVRVDKCHRLMMRLLSAQFHPCGKPLLTHVIGTASMLAAHGAEPDLVLAGLAHAAYGHGNFGSMLPGRHPAKRRVLVGAIGAGAEEILDDYSSIPWGAKAAELIAGFARLSPVRRGSLFLRVAHELEESIDFGLHYCAPVRRQSGRQNLEQVREFAKLLQLEPLVVEIDEALIGLQSEVVPACLSGTDSYITTLHSTTVPQRIMLTLKYRLRSVKYKLFGR